MGDYTDYSAPMPDDGSRNYMVYNSDNYDPNYMNSLSPNKTTTPNNYNTPTKGMNPAQEQMVAGVAQTGAGILGDVAQGIFSSSVNNSNQREARELAEQQRQDDLHQKDIEASFRQRKLDQEKQQFELQKSKEQYDLRWNRWMNILQKSVESRTKLVGAANNLFDVMKSSNLQDMIASSYQGNK